MPRAALSTPRARPHKYTHTSRAARSLTALFALANTPARRAVPFREAVDWKALQLFDYPQIIKSPMDLGTVKGKIESNGYRSLEECAEDIRLIWKNCMTYNADGSEFYNLADSFSRRFEELYAKVAGGDGGDGAADGAARGGADDSERVPTLEEKTRLSHNIYKIKSEELGELVQKLEVRCPQAIDKQQAEDEIEINIDAIEPRTFHEVRGGAARGRGARAARRGALCGTRRRARAPGAHPGPRVSAFARAQIDRFVTSCLPANKQSKKKKMAGGDESKAKKQKQ